MVASQLEHAYSPRTSGLQSDLLLGLMETGARACVPTTLVILHSPALPLITLVPHPEETQL